MKGENHPPRIHTNNPNHVELYVIIRNHNRSEFNYYGCWRSFATDPGTTVLITMKAAKANKHVPKWTKKNPASALWMPEVIDAAYQPPGQRTLLPFANHGAWADCKTLRHCKPVRRGKVWGAGWIPWSNLLGSQRVAEEIIWAPMNTSRTQRQLVEHCRGGVRAIHRPNLQF
jgi:hypothetical protein